MKKENNKRKGNRTRKDNRVSREMKSESGLIRFFQEKQKKIANWR